MANKRSDGGSRNRDLFRNEVASFLADLGDLAEELAPPARNHAAPTEPVAADAIAPATAAEEAAAELPIGTQAEVEDSQPVDAAISPAQPEKLEENAVVVTAGAETAEDPGTDGSPVSATEGPPPPTAEIAGATAPDLLMNIEDLPSFSPSYLPPLPPLPDDQEGGGAALPAPVGAAWQERGPDMAVPETTFSEPGWPVPPDDFGAPPTAHWTLGGDVVAAPEPAAEPEPEHGYPPEPRTETAPETETAIVAEAAHQVGELPRAAEGDEGGAGSGWRVREPTVSAAPPGPPGETPSHDRIPVGVTEPEPAAPSPALAGAEGYGSHGGRLGPPLVPRGIPVLISSRPWTLAAAMESLAPHSPPLVRQAPTVQPEPATAQPAATSPRRSLPQIRVPLLPAALIAVLAIIVVLIIVQLSHR
ncbi:MAG: hypothetical protein WCB85_03910 [Candidatus Dormiibacterota bacterium]